jgi:hypothetical protein
MRRAVQLGAFAAAGLLPAAAAAAGPVGAITSVTCEHIEGWAYDPDHPADAIDVHLYFDGPAGDPNANAIAVRADVMVAVGCSGDECAHGFRGQLPLSRLDGQPHAVHAYGIDIEDPNLELSTSPGSLPSCPALPLTMGLKRHIANPTTLQAWAFSTFFDMMPVADLDLAALPKGTTVDTPPQLVVDMAAPDALWLLDQGFRRPIDAKTADAWRFDVATAVPMAAAELVALPEGTPLTPRPILVQGGGAEVWVLDEHQCGEDDSHPGCAEPEGGTGDGGESDDGADAGADGDGTGGSAAGDETGSGGDDDALPPTSGAADDDASGGGCRIGDGAPGRLAFAWLLPLLGLSARGRRALGAARRRPGRDRREARPVRWPSG